MQELFAASSKVNEGEIPQYYVEGNHEAIIQPEVFELVQRELARRKGSTGKPSGVHIYSSKIKCGQCGSCYGSKVWHSKTKYRKCVWRCNRKFDNEHHCTTPHFTEAEIQAMFIVVVNQLISQKESIIAALEASLETAFDTTALEVELTEVQGEIMVVSDRIQSCIYENAHVALDQKEYQKRYGTLSDRFDKAKARFEEIEEAIGSKQSRRAAIETFLNNLRDANIVDNFEVSLWCGLLDFVTVYSRDNVVFTFRNGTEIRYSG